MACLETSISLHSYCKHNCAVTNFRVNKLPVWPAVRRQEKTYLLFQGHDGVDPEVSTLTGVSDAHRAGQEETSSQHLQAASLKFTESNTKFRDNVPPTLTVLTEY